MVCSILSSFTDTVLLISAGFCLLQKLAFSILSLQQVGTHAGSGGVSGVDAVRIFDTAAMMTSVQPLYAFR